MTIAAATQSRRSFILAVGAGTGTDEFEHKQTVSLNENRKSIHRGSRQLLVILTANRDKQICSDFNVVRSHFPLLAPEIKCSFYTKFTLCVQPNHIADRLTLNSFTRPNISFGLFCRSLISLFL